MIRRKLFQEGPVFNLFILFDDNESEVRDLIQDLDDHDSGQLTYLMDFIREQGIPKNKRKFNNEGDKIYALKTDNVRIYGFFNGEGALDLAVGFKKGGKGGKKVERRYWKRAKELRHALTGGDPGHEP
jgi:hypothetical protein